MKHHIQAWYFSEIEPTILHKNMVNQRGKLDKNFQIKWFAYSGIKFDRYSHVWIIDDDVTHHFVF